MNNQKNLPDNPNINVIHANETGLFTNYIFKAIPLAFDESMSYYETLCALLNYLKNTIIPTVNNNADAVAELQTLYEELRTFVDDYFTNLDVQEEINNKLDEMVLDGTLEEIITHYMNNNSIRTFNNVQEMTQANLITGIKAKTLGYYSINDGGNSLYYIRAKTNADVIDNGSIIELTENLVAELIVENDSINYKQFGAKLIGTNDKVAIENAHTFANSKGYKIKTGSGTLLCNFTTDVVTDVDCTGLTFIINDDTPLGVYNIISQTQRETYNYNANLSTNQRNNFTDFNKKFFVITKKDDIYKLGERQGLADGNIYYHKQPMAVDGTGRLISSPVYLGNIGTFEISYEKDLYEKGVIFKNGNIKTNLTKIGFPHFIRCTRNNCIIENFTIQNEQPQPTSTDNYAYGLFNIIGCANITVRNIVAQNNSIQPTIAHSYVLDISECFNVVLDNIVLSQGWGAIASHFCDTIKCVNSVINRFDNHYGCFGTYIISNSNFVGIGQCCAGYGNAEFIIDNCLSNGYGTDQLFYTRNDFNITFSGVLKIKDTKFLNTVSRVVLYQLGTGTANTDLSIGTFTLKLYNINLPNNNAIQFATGTTGDIDLFIFNSEIMPYASTTANFVKLYAYNSILRNIASLNICELYNCKCVSFRSQDFQGTSTMLISGGIISPAINIATLKILIAGARIFNNITCDLIVITGSYKTGSSAIITANSKHIEGCYNLS